MSPKSILQFFKPKQQDLLVDSTNVDKRLADLRNEQLEQVYTSSPESKKRGRYQILSPADKAEVGRYATQHSTPQTVSHFKDKYDLKATSVRNFKAKYLKEILEKTKIIRRF